MHHLAPLTSLRFCAALAIGIFHLQGTLGWGSPYAPLANGVSFFFVLSGFILAYTHGRKPAESVLAFYRLRVARIWPLHLVTWLFALVVFNAGMIADRSWWPFAAGNALLLHAFVPVPAYILAFNSVSWSLSAELFFYGMFPLLVRVERIGRATAALVLVPVATALAFDAAGVVEGTDPWSFSSTSLLLQNPVFRLAEFTIGVWAGRSFKAAGRSAAPAATARSTLIATAAEVACLVVLLAFLATSTAIKEALTGVGLFHLGIWYHQCAGMAVFALLIVVFGRAEGYVSRALCAPVLVRLGEISFAFYMVHLQIMVWAMNERWVERFGWGPSVAAVLVLALSLSWLLWRFVEMPARDLIAGSGRSSRAGRLRSRPRRASVADGSTRA